MGRKIVVVDDDNFDISMLRRGIEAAGVDIDLVSVNDSNQAIPVLRGEQPDLAVLDLRMPPPDGLGILEALREDDQVGGLKVLILSGSPSVSDKQRAEELGANWYRVKPGTLDGYRQLGVEIYQLAAQ